MVEVNQSVVLLHILVQGEQDVPGRDQGDVGRGRGEACREGPRGGRGKGRGAGERG